jgi:hypothetical protein
MRIFGFIILGIAIAYLLLFLGEIGLVALGGGVFGLLLYIAVTITKK